MYKTKDVQQGERQLGGKFGPRPPILPHNPILLLNPGPRQAKNLKTLEE